MLYFILGVLAPILLNLMHLVVGIYVTLQRGSVMSLGFSAAGFLTKTIGMLFLTWLGVGYFELDLEYMYHYLHSFGSLLI